MKKVLYYILLGCMLVAGLPACTDEPLMDGGGEIPEGETTLSAVVNFKPFGEALTGKSRSAGNAIKTIENLCVLFYADEDEGENKVQKLVDCQYYDASGFTVNNDVPRTDTPSTSDKEHQAEASTPQATISRLVIPYGRYYVYVVANMGDLNKNYSEAIQTSEGLKKIQLNWKYTPKESTSTSDDETETATKEETASGDETEKVKTNNQMFGYFTIQKEGESVSTSRPGDFDAPLLTIDKSVSKLHAWIRRAASKVTIAYDATKLRDNIHIYLKSVRIKDIPKNCLLGAKNSITDEGYPSSKLLDGEIIDYTKGELNYEKWPKLIMGEIYGLGNTTKDIDVEKQKKAHHAEDVPALYFYENMQGIGAVNTASDKRQDVSGNNKVISYPNGNTPPDPNDSETDPSKTGFKDAKPYGTYIEVEAYYYNGNAGDIGYGRIIYRFMLGKDDHLDYNAERNYHYKLTLRFNGNANDVDWHIDYEEEEPEIYLPNPYYISYLYNHSMTFPLKIRTGGKTIEKVTAEITDNRWAPKDPGSFSYWRAMDIEGENQWNGFLSLHKTVDTRLSLPAGATQYTIDSNKSYYESEPKRGERTYTIPENLSAGEPYKSTGEGGNVEPDDEYTVTKEKEEENTFHLEIPMYTRAKQLIKGTAYTGNNPYVAYQRSAKVNFTVWFKNQENQIDTLQKEIEIIQARRIVNPKGVYRSWDNTAPFRAVLKILNGEDQKEFVPLKSDGSWKAYVVAGDKNLVSLKPGNEDDATLNEKEGVVYGRTDSYMDFYINFNSTVLVSKDESKYAIVRVEYNNYTCQHLIFIRRGYAPDDLLPGGAKWHTKNMVTKDNETNTPLEEGSLFKFGNWSQPIDASNNVNPADKENGYWINVNPKDFKGPGSTLLTLASSGEATWSNITSQKSDGTGFGTASKVATVEDYAVLYKSDVIEQGYGVLYGDDATKTLTDLNQVYGVDKVPGHGMRGCFVYNRDMTPGYTHSGKNVFFPIGASGYGHRKAKEDGMLRYSCGRTGYFLTNDEGTASTPPSNGMYANVGINAAPLFYDLYMRPGAIYWAKERHTDIDFNEGGASTDGNNIVGWDFNYFTFDFYPIVPSNVWKTANNSEVENGSDACFIRCVDR